MKPEKELKGIAALLLILLTFSAKADTWYPAGNNNLPAPVAVYANGDYFFTIHPSKISTDSFDYYTPARYDGKIWQNLPMLKIYKGGKINAIIRFNDDLVVGGEFLLPSRKVNNLVHLTPKGLWESFGLFNNGDTSRTTINALEVFNGELFAAGKFKNFKGVLYNNIVRFNKVWANFSLEKNSNVGSLEGTINVLSSNGTSLVIAGDFTNFVDDKAVNNLLVINTSYLQTSKPASLKGKVLSGKWFNGNFYFFLDNAGQKSIQAFVPSNNAATSVNSNISFIQSVIGFFVYESKLYAHGEIKVSGVLQSVVRLDGTTWVGYVLSFKPRHLAVFQNRLLATGDFQGFSIRQNPVSVVQLLTGVVRISGKVYHDVNSNCQYDGNDKPLAERLVIMTAPQRNSITKTDINGFWEFLIVEKSAQAVTLKTEQPKYWSKPACETNPVKIITHVSRDSGTINFPSVIVSQTKDLQVTLTSALGWHARKDFRETYNIKIQNNGTQTTKGIVTFKTDRKLEGNVKFSLKPDGTGPNELSWEIDSLKPGEERNIQVYPLIKSSQLNINDEIECTASVSVPNDGAPNDNNDTLENLISGPTATFGKYAEPNPNKGDTAFIQKGQDEIRYTISFENNGTDTVRTARVIDTLDLTYYIGYTQETGASHPYTTYIYQDPTNIYKGIFVWTFNNINLAPNPSKNPEMVNSRGYIGFKVKFDPNTPTGTMVKNTATVIFDQGIQNGTNSVWCKYDEQNGVGIKKPTIKGLLVYPNPATNLLNITFGKPFKGKAELFDLSGKMLLSESLDGVSQKTLSTESYSNGIYFLKISGNQGSTVVKTIVSR